MDSFIQRQFRLLDKKPLQAINEINEKDIFFRGLVSWIGFRQYRLRFIPNERNWGKTNYSLRKMIMFAITGITSFSTRPLTFSVILGLVISLISFIYALYAIYTKLFTDNTVSGWTSTIFSILFIGGINLIVLGIVGQYIGKLFDEVKKRPSFIIREES